MTTGDVTAEFTLTVDDGSGIVVVQGPLVGTVEARRLAGTIRAVATIAGQVRTPAPLAGTVRPTVTLTGVVVPIP